ncbi:MULTISPECIES: rod shape-determining protein MreC [Treponema]|uniref:Cell shape-determining protein MreC n=1 Tax=Treponema berlinense TaxID=225004 RepID=A0A1T4KVX7_9SPIR|nr:MULTISPECIES: rod shape-determining protein MreC [Treponema]MBQ9102401.1 rod shape-determining protein MreC [Treponema sp.]MDY3707027.1 rod shape-determining protein MreC [Treponema berlinense]SJZ46579.1 rod shape-determining protein MreC [Treponema berlinense]
MARRSFSFSFAEFVFLILLFLSGLALAFSGGGFVVNFQRVGFSVVTSLQKAVYSVCDGVTGVFTAVAELKSLKAENQELKEKLKNYEFLQRNNTEIRKENERLREQLQFATHIEQKNFPAQIIGRNPDNIYSGITINKGSRSGIKKGMSVIAVQNGTTGLVGKIVTVGLETSLVMPVYDSKCVVSSRIQNTRDIGLVSGSGNANSPLQMKYIKKRVLSELNFGDIVVTSGETDNYVADIPVGTITNIMVVEYDSSLNIEITPVVDFARLETVIVTDLKEPNPLLEGSRR